MKHMLEDHVCNNFWIKNISKMCKGHFKFNNKKTTQVWKYQSFNRHSPKTVCIITTNPQHLLKFKRKRGNSKDARIAKIWSNWISLPWCPEIVKWQNYYGKYFSSFLKLKIAYSLTQEWNEKRKHKHALYRRLLWG